MACHIVVRCILFALIIHEKCLKINAVHQSNRIEWTLCGAIYNSCQDRSHVIKSKDCQGRVKYSKSIKPFVKL